VPLTFTHCGWQPAAVQCEQASRRRRHVHIHPSRVFDTPLTSQPLNLLLRLAVSAGLGGCRCLARPFCATAPTCYQSCCSPLLPRLHAQSLRIPTLYPQCRCGFACTQQLSLACSWCFFLAHTEWKGLHRALAVLRQPLACCCVNNILLLTSASCSCTSSLLHILGEVDCIDLPLICC
jgi:hypothetical protein